MSTVTMTLSPSRPQVPPSQANRFEVVPARWEDMEKIADFLRSTADWYRPIIDEKDMAEHAVDEKWAEINFERRDFYLGVVDGEAVGTVSLQYFREFAYIGYIYLDAEHVGKGYGQRLMRFAESVARRNEAESIVLLAHPDANWAKRAYLKYGFNIIESAKADVLAWQEGALKPYYEEGFELYEYDLAKSDKESLS